MNHPDGGTPSGDLPGVSWLPPPEDAPVRVPVPRVAPPPPHLSWAPPLESTEAAFDGALGEDLALGSAVDGDDGPAPGLEPVPSPPPRVSHRGRHRRLDETARRADAVGGELPPPLPPAPRGGSGQPVVPEFDDIASPPPPPRRRWWQLGGSAPDQPGTRRHRTPWWELPVLVGVAIVIAILVKSFVVQPFYIPSQSMEKTLHGCPGCKGDRILVNKPIYDLRDPHPGDIVVFHAPAGWEDEPPSVPPSNPVLRLARGFGQLIGFVPPDGLVLVKRVVAIGGQTVKGDSSGAVMVSEHGVNGPWKTLSEPFVYLDGPDTHAAFGPVTIPKGRIWVMGDHRNDSKDSRFHCGPGGTEGDDGPTCDPTSSTVPVSAVIGKAVVIAWPPSRWRTLGTPSTFKSLGEGLPVLSGAVAVLPVLVLRRRRRNPGRTRRRHRHAGPTRRRRRSE
jgi:signal peptidase I